MESQEIEPGAPGRKEHLNDLFSGLFLFSIFYFIGSGIAIGLISMLGWTDRYTGFYEGKFTDAESAMVFRFVNGIFSLSWMGLPMLIWAGRRGRIKEVLKLNQRLPWKTAILASVIMIVSIPVISFMVIDPEMFNSSAEVKEALKRFESDSGRVSILLLSDITMRGFSANLFFLCLIPAFVEEIFFRGFFQSSIARIWNAHGAIFLTAALFSLIHFQLLAFFPRFILGIFLGYYFARTGNLWVNILAHFIFNAANITMGFIDQTLLDENYQFSVLLLLASTILTGGLFFLFLRRTKMEGDPVV